jgi:hypothetical protein
MTTKISRRELLGMTAAGAVASVSWMYRVDTDGNIVRQIVDSAETFKPEVLSKKEMSQLEALCETIIPQSDTSGAKTARVHEYIDVALSLEPKERQDKLRGGLKWLEKHCKATQKTSIAKASETQLIDLLTPLSDEHETHPDELKPGAALFRDLKSRTIFAFFTSKEGRVETLGLPEHTMMVKLEGCPHAGNH